MNTITWILHQIIMYSNKVKHLSGKITIPPSNSAPVVRGKREILGCYSRQKARIFCEDPPKLMSIQHIIYLGCRSVIKDQHIIYYKTVHVIGKKVLKGKEENTSFCVYCSCNSNRTFLKSNFLFCFWNCNYQFCTNCFCVI